MAVASQTKKKKDAKENADSLVGFCKEKKGFFFLFSLFPFMRFVCGLQLWCQLQTIVRLCPSIQVAKVQEPQGTGSPFGSPENLEHPLCLVMGWE